MNPSRDDTIFSAAQELPAAERAAFLDRACAGDAAQRERVAALLAAGDDAGGFMKQPLAARGADAAEEKPGDTIGRYKLLQKIGEGGCGIVYMAEQEVPVRRRVALKVIKLGMDTRAVIARFEAERQALALMEHPNIAKVLDAGATATGRPFFVMELVRGIAITRYCDEHQLTPRARLELFVEVCAAIQHAHQKGIIHRDIKPSNILVTVNDGAPVPKVIDFGVAKATQGRLTEQTMFTAFEQFIGTPVYMSPEQADMSSLDIDTRSDIYSLGVLLYELLAGQPPFDAQSFAHAGVDELRRQIREVEPPPPSTRLRTLSAEESTMTARRRGTVPAQLTLLLRGDLDWIVMRCLEKDRTRRYDTANSLALDVQRHLRNEPVFARPPSTAYLLGKLIRRHRLAFAAAAAIALALLLGGGFSVWQAVRATRAEREKARMLANESALRARAENAELATRRRAYVADVNLVQQALAADNLARAQDLLNRQRPHAGEVDLRGWEWRYLWQFCQSDALTTLTTKAETTINSIALSADGAWLAAGETSYGGLSVWNLRTREEIRLAAGRSGVRVAFSPTEPLLAVATGSTPGAPAQVMLWDAGTRRFVREFSLGNGFCSGLFFSADGRTLVTSRGNPQNEITLWRVADGTKIASHAAPANNMDVRFGAFAVTRDQRLAAYFRGPPATVRVIELATGRERWSAVAADENLLTMAFSPDGKILATGAGWTEGAIRLWDAESGKELGRLEGHRRGVGALVFLPDGRTLISGSADSTIRVWDLTERRLVRTLRGHRAELNTIALFPDGRTLASGSKDGSIAFWDVFTDRAKEAAIRLPGGPQSWRFFGDAVIVVEPVGRNVDRVVERRGRDFSEQKTLLDLRELQFPHALLAPDATRVAAWHPRRRIAILDWSTKTQLAEIPLDDGGGQLGVTGFRRGAEKILITRAFADGTAKLQEWDIATARKLREWPLSPSAPMVAVSPDERYFAGAANVGRFTRMPEASGEENAYVRTEFASAAVVALSGNTRESGEAGAAFSPDGRFYACGSALGFVDVLDVPAWRKITTLSGVVSGMYGPAFSPDSSRLAVGGSGADSLIIWDTTTFERVLTFPTASSVMAHIAFSPDGTLLGARSAVGGMAGANGSDQGMFYLWRAPSWAEIEAAEKRQAQQAR